VSTVAPEAYWTEWPSADAVAARLDDYGHYCVQIERQCGGKRRTVELTLQLQAATGHIYPNQNLSAVRHKTPALSLAVATEVACVELDTQADCFDADNALAWSLLTSVPIGERNDVQRIVRFYALRWRIERLHFTLKSGALNGSSNYSLMTYTRWPTL
jgi:hypothetical protein